MLNRPLFFAIVYLVRRREHGRATALRILIHYKRWCVTNNWKYFENILKTIGSLERTLTIYQITTMHIIINLRNIRFSNTPSDEKLFSNFNFQGFHWGRLWTLSSHLADFTKKAAWNLRKLHRNHLNFYEKIGKNIFRGDDAKFVYTKPNRFRLPKS